MNIWVKRAMVTAGIATAMALPMSGQASDGTITFTGAVTASTCTINVNGSGNGNGAILLPTVDTSALTNTGAGTTAAGTFFNIALSDCAAATDIGNPAAAPTTVAIYFEAGPNVDEATGGLINTVAGSNVEVNLYNASAASIVGTHIKPGTQTNQPTAVDIAPITAATETQWFYAGYSTAGADVAATAGAVSTSVTYSLVYN
jgi:major type 1 subunit fimbrin (pilin)